MVHQVARTILYVILSVTISMALGCGGKSEGGSEPDGALVDSAVDGDIEDAGDRDGAAGDGGAAGQSSQCITSGGGRVFSGDHRLKLFIAPVSPVGGVASPNYRINLGPASTGDSL